MTIDPKLLSAEEFNELCRFSALYEGLSPDEARQIFAHVAAQVEQIAAQDAEIERLIDQHDAAEEALSQAYFLVIGKSPEWSNVFGSAEALEEIDDAQRTLRAVLTPQPKDQNQ
jgi:hypothetical protein